MRFSLGKKNGRSVSSVQVKLPYGGVEEYTTKDEANAAIFRKVHQKRFFLVEEAPICQGTLRESLGYLSRSQTAEDIINGTYNYPPEVDEATQDLCLECAQIRTIIPEDSVSPTIKTKQWIRGWKRMKEDTSSSESGLHFGHYKAGADSALISQFHVLKATLLMKRGLVLNQWGRGLSVMIEKLFGYSLVFKQRSILLMEAQRSVWQANDE